MTDIRAGDVVVCVDEGRIDTCPYCEDNEAPQSDGRGMVGGFFTAARVSADRTAISLRERPGEWCILHFRKVEAPKTELSERIRKCRPVRIGADA